MLHTRKRLGLHAGGPFLRVNMNLRARLLFKKISSQRIEALENVKPDAAPFCVVVNFAPLYVSRLHQEAAVLQRWRRAQHL